jgi:hypothetical protein
MTAIGMGLAFGAYTLGLWGYCLVRGYDVPFGAMFAQTWPGTQSAEQAPAGGHKLGTITSPGISVTDPGQIASGLGG